MIRLRLVERSPRWIATRLSLLSRLKNWQDNESWKAFIDNYSPLIYWTALRCGLNHTAAEEVAQEVLVAVSRKISAFKHDPARGSFKGWLLRITQNQVNNYFRRQSRDKKVLISQTEEGITDLNEVPDTANPTMEDIWEAEWEQNLWKAALENLKLKVSVREYQIFDAFEVQKWKGAKVAEVFGVSLANAHVIKHRMKMKFRKEYKTMHSKTFEDYFFERPGATEENHEKRI